jgi:hypothetical protein
VALAHRASVVADPLEPYRGAARMGRGVPLDQPPGTPEDARQCRRDLLGTASSAPLTRQRGVERGVRRVLLAKSREVAGLDGRPKPLDDLYDQLSQA